MKYKVVGKIICAALWLLASSAMASTTWYVNGVSGSDNNNCTSPTTACKTIGHAIALASSGDSVKVAAAIYTENLNISFNLRISGSGARTTIIDGGGLNTVVTISSWSAHVILSGMTIRNGTGGIWNRGALLISNTTVSANTAGFGGGIYNVGYKLMISKSTISGNSAGSGGGIGTPIALKCCLTVTINSSTISGNSGGGIFGTLGSITNINNSTISGNSACSGCGGGIFVDDAKMKIQNSIVANNVGGNCSSKPLGNEITSNGYNLSSDGTCPFSNTGDMNNTDPMLGPLQNNGGPTQTMALPTGSPAVDAGNPNGCTNSQGVLLKTDQRGMPRPDSEDTGGCDIGAYERQTD